VNTTAGVYRLSRQSKIVLTFTSLIAIAGFVWPFFYVGNLHWIFVVAIAAAALLLISEVGIGSIDAKSIALLGVMSAFITLLRPLGAGAAGLEPIWFALIIAARVFGPSWGFLLGVTSMTTSALLTGGVGPWLAYQVFAAGWIGLLAGALPQKFAGKLIRGASEKALLIVVGVFASFAFGILMDLQFWPWVLGSNTQLSYIPGAALSENFSRFITFHFASSMAWDVPRAILTSILIVLTATPFLRALRRTYFKAAFLTPIEFKKVIEIKN
jgi:energy-coupling factor transport system substrate-specific component